MASRNGLGRLGVSTFLDSLPIDEVREFAQRVEGWGYFRRERW